MAVNAESAKRDIGSGSRWHNPRHILFAIGSAQNIASIMDDELMRLAERCEAAMGPDRELDALIQMAVRKREPLLQADRLPMKPRHFTASLDAAMTLVPEGWTAWELRSRRRLTRFTAEISRLCDDIDDADGELIECGNAATPALALCAAALRARTQKDSGNG